MGIAKTIILNFTIGVDYIVEVTKVQCKYSLSFYRIGDHIESFLIVLTIEY
jgi:hypothetical protein